MKNLILILALLLTSLKMNAQHDHSPVSPTGNTEAPRFHNAQLGKAFAFYLEVKDALVASNAETARNAASQLHKSLKAIPGSEKISQEAAKIGATIDIAEQRKAFSALTTGMTTLVKDAKLSAGSVYIDFCPMANNNAGASWLSVEKEIRNPYFGDRMLKCGSIKETIR